VLIFVVDEDGRQLSGMIKGAVKPEGIVHSNCNGLVRAWISFSVKGMIFSIV
jgi:isoleucyl-tRNA synthetase